MDLGNDFYDETAQSLDTEYALSEQQKRGMVLFFAVTLLSVLLVSFCGAGESFIDCCPKFFFCCKRACRRRRQDSESDDQYSQDRALAETLQRQLNEEERQRERLSKRKERRMWYEYYIKPWTMIVGKSDLFLVYDDEDAGTKMKDIERSQQPKVGDEPSQDSDIEEVNDDPGKPHSMQCYECNNDENATLYVKLSRSNRCVDATCTFCLDEYEVGDHVVWSNLECQHVFHKECLMQWLSKGKKRCPICRHWFVPGTKIDDQKQSHGEAWRRALSEMERAEKKEREKQAAKAEIEAEPLNALEEGRAEPTASPDIPIRTPPEPQHMESDRDVLICNVPNDDSRHSEHPVTTEFNDIESNVTAVASGEERNSISDDTKDTDEAKKDRQGSFKSEVLLGEE